MVDMPYDEVHESQLAQRPKRELIQGRAQSRVACSRLLSFNQLSLCCRLVEDTAWHPVTKEELVQWKGTVKGSVFKAFLGSPLKSWASVGHWLIYHFDLQKYSAKQQDRVCTSPCSVQVGPGIALL